MLTETVSKRKIIRPATPEDTPRLVEMGIRFLRESPYHKHFAENPERMGELVHQLLNGLGGILVADNNGTLTGMIGFLIYDHFISGERMAAEAFWWVEPESRGDGIRLLRESEKVVKQAGAKAMQMIAPNDRVGSLYERMGYVLVEKAYQRAL